MSKLFRYVSNDTAATVYAPSGSSSSSSSDPVQTGDAMDTKPSPFIFLVLSLVFYVEIWYIY